MPRVQLTTDRVGEGWLQNQGDIIEVDEAEARSLLMSGQATLVREEVRETAVAPGATENTAIRFHNNQSPRKRRN